MKNKNKEDLKKYSESIEQLASSINADRLILEGKVEVLSRALKLIIKRLTGLNDTVTNNIVKISEKALDDCAIEYDSY